MMDALEAGAADFEADGPALEITCDPDAFNDVVKALEGKGYAFASAEIEMVPQNYITQRSTVRTWRSSSTCWRTTTTCRTSGTTGTTTEPSLDTERTGRPVLFSSPKK